MVVFPHSRLPPLPPPQGPTASGSSRKDCPPFVAAQGFRPNLRTCDSTRKRASLPPQRGKGNNLGSEAYRFAALSRSTMSSTSSHPRALPAAALDAAAQAESAPSVKKWRPTSTPPAPVVSSSTRTAARSARKCGARDGVRRGTVQHRCGLERLPQVHLRKPCYDFSFL